VLFKKREKVKKRVVCPIPVVIAIIQECVDIDAGYSEFVVRFEGEEHTVGFTSD